MTMRLAKITLAVSLAVPLAACSTFFGSHQIARHAVKSSEASAANASALADNAATSVVAKNYAAIGEGRGHLAGGRYGLAIASFRTAMVNGEPAAPALNGLGVAYANLGRFDLAQRYFLEAIAADPGNERYAANLSRLMLSPAMAMRRDGDVGAALLRSEAARQGAPQMQPATAAAAPQRGRLSKVSSHEFHIATVAPLTAPRAALGARAIPGFKSLVRLEFSRTAGGGSSANLGGFKPLARIQLREASPAVVVSSRAGVAPGAARR